MPLATRVLLCVEPTSRCLQPPYHQKYIRFASRGFLTHDLPIVSSRPLGNSNGICVLLTRKGLWNSSGEAGNRTPDLFQRVLCENWIIMPLVIMATKLLLANSVTLIRLFYILPLNIRPFYPRGIKFLYNPRLAEDFTWFWYLKVEWPYIQWQSIKGLFSHTYAIVMFFSVLRQMKIQKPTSQQGKKTRNLNKTNHL